METAEVPQALQHTWSGHARTHVSEVYKKLLKQRERRLGWAERAGIGFSLPERKNPRNAQLAQLIEFRKAGYVVELGEDVGGREGIRTPGLLVANEEKSKIRCGTTIT
jgi:hypothetical protein